MTTFRAQPPRRHRLGVVLLVPPGVAQEVDALRRAMEDGALSRVAPHITLVPPVNVRADALDRALDVVRAAAGEQPEPLRLELGPVATFHPLTPVVYLPVGGAVDGVRSLRAALDREPLLRPSDFPFVPHVTLTEAATPDVLAACLLALAGYTATIDVDRLTVLEEGDDRVWRPVADAPFGADTRPLMRGPLRVLFQVASIASPAGADAGRYASLIVEATVDGRFAGVARGRVAVDDKAWLDELVVVDGTRSSGVGSALARRFASEAAQAGATELRASRGATLAGFLARMGYRRETIEEWVLPL